MTSHTPRFLPGPRLRALALALAAVLCAVPAAAQNGTLQGHVLDAAGAPIASAVVEANRDASSLRRGTVTDPQGAYRITGLPPGSYQVRVRRSGYRNSGGSLLLGPGENLVQDWVMQTRPLVMDTVTAIAGSQTVISRENTEYSTTINETALELLPTAHDPAELVTLTPGARPGQVWGGATAQANSYQIDGLAANHPGVGGDLIKPSISWIESVDIRGLGAAAEYGNFQGGLINITTKSGTNDFEAVLHASTETAALTGSNLQQYDLGAEIRSRYDLEAELRGPLVRNHLFYYLAGQVIRRDEQVVNHQRFAESFYHPELIEWEEQKAFGKLLWQPTRRDQLSASGGYIGAVAQGFGATGYETNARQRMEAPSTFYNVEFTHLFAPGTEFEVAVGGFERDERQEPADPGIPGIVNFGDSPRPTYQNVPFRYRMAPASSTVSGSLSLEARTFGITHAFKVGGEYVGGSWTSQKLRNGGMTWRPPALSADRRFDAEDPSTWKRFVPFIPSDWGGEVDLNADVRNASVYVQDNIEVSSRLSISPGVRFGWWEGYITPGGGVGPRFLAMSDAQPEARLGLTLDITGRNDLVAKAHAGRYHQNMFAQFYDRVAGGNVFSNQQLWYYRGDLTDPTTRFTTAERDALAQQGLFDLWEEIRLNQTGPVENFRQPYVDQLVVGVEKQLGRWLKAEVVYVDRVNGNMVSLVDRNAESNYTAFRNVFVWTEAGEKVMYNGAQVFMPTVYIPNYAVREVVELISSGALPGPYPPGITPAIASTLTWDPDYVLTNVDAAKRHFRQVQVVMRAGFPRFGGTLSVVYSDLEGNLDNVSGYEDPTGFGAGPFVNPNQAVNFSGELPNFSPWEIKLSLYGNVGAGIRGGIFWNEALGDRYTPHFTLSGLKNSYRNSANAELKSLLFYSVAGQPVFIGQRGALEYRNRSTIDLHMERGVTFGPGEWLFSLDAFNIFARDTPLEVNTSVNEGKNYTPFLDLGVEPTQYFGAVRERQRPRSIRMGAIVRF
jgi:Carboxypeptidase regulatory-like domain